MSEIKITNGKVQIDGKDINDFNMILISLNGDPDPITPSDIGISYYNKEQLEYIEHKYEIEELTLIAKVKKVMP